MDVYEARRLALQALIDDRYGGSQASFCADTGVAASYLSRMLKPAGEPNRKRIGEDMATRIESALDLEPGLLLRPATTTGKGSRGERQITGRKPDDFGSAGELQLGYSQSHRVGGKVDLAVMDVRASMGHGAAQPSRDNVVMSMVVDEAWLRRHASFSHPENLGILTGIGDSMQPTFEDGDPLLVDRSVNDVKLDAVYVLSLNDELFIKRLQRRPGTGEIVMISDNKAYEPHVIKGSERDRFQVLGRVVMVWNARKI